ncbi:MAG: C10 family peptidase, partial [Candidatus Delongbacteria bacterium]
EYWNWPQQGEFIQSYYHETYGEISVDFNQEFYNWDAISPTTVNADVKELLYHAGVSVRMNYGPNSSSAQSSMISTALRSYFRYQDAARMVWRSSYSAETWRTMLHAELSAGRPVIYRGQGPNGGHAFDVDGVQDSTWFHINWGWSGSYNGYFLLDDLSPGNYYFGDVQGAVIGIAPDGMPVNHQPLVPAVYLEINENETASTTFNGYDVDGDELTYSVGGQTITGDTWSWTPAPNAHGTFSFTYQACDQSGCSQPADLIVVVHSVNQLPVVAGLELESLEDEALAIQLAGFDADADTLQYLVNGQLIAGDTFNWTPPANAAGDYSFTYTACDAAGCGETALLLVHVLPVNDAPQASPVLAHILEGGVQHIQLAGWDVDSDSLTYVIDGVAQTEDIFTVEILPGLDHTFHYYVNDGQAVSDTMSIIVTFAPKGPGKEYVEETNFSNRSGLNDGLAGELPVGTSLRPAYPNPFNPSTALPIELAQSGHVRLSIYNVAGQRVAVLLDGTLEAGRHELRWSAGQLASGAYLAVLESSAGLSTQILHLVK